MKAVRIPLFVLAVLLAFSVCNAVHLTRRCHAWQAGEAEEGRRGGLCPLRRAVLLCQADSEELRPTLAELHACLGMVAETQQISIKNIL